MASRNEFILNNSKNFCYIFIPEQYLGNFPYVIRNKRAEQIKKLVSIANASSQEDFDQLVSDMSDRLEAEYGYNGFDLVNAMCEGKNIVKKSGVGSVADAEADTSMEIDPRAGFPVSAEVGSYFTTGVPMDVPTTLDINGELYSSTFNNETKQPIGVFSLNSGKQVSYYDSSTNSFKAGTSGTSNFWSNVLQFMPFLVSILDWIGQLFGIKETSEISSMQTDGWYSPSSGSTTLFSAGGTWPLMLIGGLVIFGILNSKDSKPKSGAKKK